MQQNPYVKLCRIQQPVSGSKMQIMQIYKWKRGLVL